MDDEPDDIEEEGGPDPIDDEVCPEGTPEWLVTFGDMMSLLLTFFILLLSFAQMEIVKYRMLAGSVLQAFGVQEKEPAFNRPQANNIAATEFSMSFSTKRTFNGMRSTIERHSARTSQGRVDVEVFEDYRGVVVKFGEEAMFEAGRADIRPAMWPFIDDLLKVAMRDSAFIRIEAHTDSTPISGPRFPSNDHLSAARAISVARYLQGRAPGLASERVEAVALGATRPLAPNFTETSRRRNRRIELVFYVPPGDYRDSP